jgi:hypothetical protein
MKNAVFWESAATCSRWFLPRGFFYPEDGGQFTQEVHGATSQKTAFFKVQFVKLYWLRNMRGDGGTR